MGLRLKYCNKLCLGKEFLFRSKKYYQHPVLSNYAASKDGEVVNTKSGKILKMDKSNGYCRFSICDKKN